jgi:copper chaperone CopZ
MFSLFSKNQSKDKHTKKVTFHITGMHCVACSMNIDGELEDTPGVTSAKTSYAKAVCDVEYDPSTITIDEMKEVVGKLGYSFSDEI